MRILETYLLVKNNYVIYNYVQRNSVIADINVPLVWNKILKNSQVRNTINETTMKSV